MNCVYRTGAILGLLILPFCRTAESAVIIGTNAYALTTTKVNYNSNWLNAVQTDFGSEAKVADFSQLKIDFSANVASLVSLLGSSVAFVTYNNDQFYSSSRGYFVEVHNGVVPGGWLVHDTIAANTVDLGSWSLTSQSVLATYAVPEPSALSLLAAGIAGMVALRRVRRRTV